MKSFSSNEKREKRKKIKEAQLDLFSSNLDRERNDKYASYYRKEPVKNIVLYEAFFGRGILCNCNGLFQEFIKRPDFEKYEHVWVVEDHEGNRVIMEQYSDYKNVKFVEYLSNEYFYYLACAKILVNNSTFPSFFTKKENQIYINTWHGVPLKRMGYDEAEGNLVAANTVRNFLAADYLLAPCDYQADIYKSAFKLDGIFRGKLVVEGQPRNDLIYSADSEKIIRKMESLGVAIEPDKKIILYAPTWKGKSFQDPQVDIDAYFEFFALLESKLPKEEYQILIKPHQAVYNKVKNDDRMNGKFVPAIMDANEVLAVTDILVADYSSIYFDFMVTGRPILFYIPDIEEYRSYRGLYLPLEDLPGPQTEELSKIPEWILSIDQIKNEFHQKYEEQKNKFVYKEDGQTSKRIWEIVLDESKQFQITDGLINNKIKVLAFLGVAKVNGITESLNSLLNMVDYDKFEMTISVISSSEKNVTKKICEINPKARVLTRVGLPVATLDEAVDNEMVIEYSLSEPGIERYYPEKFYHREYRRNFGDAKFDYVLNFSGYSGFNSILFLQAKEAKKFIWQHNDLLQDKNRTVHGVKINEKPLGTSISAYPYYDKMVSCSESVMHVNKKNLATEETSHKYTFCRNLVNFERVFAGMEQEDTLTADGKEYLVKKESQPDDSEMTIVEMTPIPEKGNINFVTMGRLSPEKNHHSMILAFARFHREVPNSHLYILGDGPLMYDLQRLAIEECCIDGVSFLGNILNPFAFMKHCDCFVLPSIHEGQPMVLLEARAIGLPIIVSDFSTVTDSLIENGQLLIKTDIESIYSGFMAFAKGEVPKVSFDYNGYNRNAYMEFERLFAEEV